MHSHKHHVSKRNEKKTLSVILITLVAMVIEIVYGYLTNSMALLADGYHMGTHVLALGLTFVAYLLIRFYADSPLFENGPHKIGTLAAYTSSIFLAITGVWISCEAIYRFFNPEIIVYNDAILVASIGFIVNIICLFVMHKDEQMVGSCCKHNHEKEDYNFKAAYYHILADALTSILAIFALLIGKYLNLNYLDSLVGIMGGVLILRWALGLLKHTTKELIDMK